MDPTTPNERRAQAAQSELGTMHDTDAVIKEADGKFDAKDLDGARMVYQSALLDWVDDAREGTDEDPELMKEKVTTLWIAYANLNKRAKMFKSTTEAFEAATSCPIAGSMGSVWLEYARFQEERNRHRTAQNVYLRALVGDDNSGAAVKDEANQRILWNEFLRMMRGQTKNPSLTLQELRSAVEQEHVASIKDKQPGTEQAFPDAEVTEAEVGPAASSDVEGSAPSSEEPPSKRVKLNDVTAAPTVHIEPSAGIAANKSLQPVTAKGIETQAASLLSDMGKMPPELTAAWLARDGDSPPSRPEPPLFTPSPPKFSDASGKDILGDELALKLIRTLLKKSEKDDCGSTLLEICQGCWMMTALKEKEMAKPLEELDQKMIAEREALEANLEARASVAGGALAAVQQINDGERNDFIAKCNQQRQHLVDSIAWQFRELLAVQQQILTKACLPGFDGPTVDASVIALQANVCSFMHSAFYLRARIGEKQHLAMLKSQEGRFSSKKKEPSPPPRQMQHPQVGHQNPSAQNVAFQLHPVTQSFQPPPPFPPGQIPHPQQGPYQQHGVYQQQHPFPAPHVQPPQQAFGAPPMPPIQGHAAPPMMANAPPMHPPQGQPRQQHHVRQRRSNYR